MSIRQAAVAGMFYPEDPVELHRSVQRYLKGNENQGLIPKVLVLPHAGYIYSGQTAGLGYQCLESLRSTIKKVVLLGPCHRVPVRGIAVPQHESFNTPLGSIKLDQKKLAEIINNSNIQYSDEAHAQEHSLEVHLPFLQEMLDDFVLLPLVVGEASAGLVAKTLEILWGGPETLIVISTDLSHFLSYQQANKADAFTINKILNFEANLVGEEACGCRPLNGLLQLAKQQDLSCDLLHHCNSGDTAGDKQRVVGYASFILY